MTRAHAIPEAKPSLAKVRALATSILAGVQVLEDTEVHESWTPADIENQIGFVVKALGDADSSLYGFAEGLTEPI